MEKENNQKEKRTIVVNLIGGQGAGKSTTMADLFAWLKWHNIDSEMCTEFAKELVWDNRKDAFKDELYIFAKQNHRLFRCNGKVDVIVTDRPLIMSVAYNRFYGDESYVNWNSAYEKMVIETFNRYNNFNVYLNRVKPYNENGRNETEDEARRFDKRFKDTLNELAIDYVTLDGCEESVEKIGKMIQAIVLASNVK